MSSDYRGALARILNLLSTAYPDRVVTRSYKDFADHKDADLSRGIYTILPRGVEGYDYEASDPSGGVDGPRQTELGAFVFTIVGQQKLQKGSDGEAIDAAEFAMLHELESFADAGIDDDDLKDLLLRRTVMSQQLEAPYAWVYTEWRLRLFD